MIFFVKKTRMNVRRAFSTFSQLRAKDFGQVATSVSTKSTDVYIKGGILFVALCGFAYMVVNKNSPLNPMGVGTRFKIGPKLEDDPLDRVKHH